MITTLHGLPESHRIMTTVSADFFLSTASCVTSNEPGTSLARPAPFWLRLLRLGTTPRRSHAGGDASSPPDKRAVTARIHERLVRSARDKQPMTVIVFAINDLPQVESVFGASVARDVLAHVSDKLERMAGRAGLAVRTAATEFTVLLPWADRVRAVRTVDSIFGRPCRVEFEKDHDEILVLPDFEVSTLDCDSASIDATYQKLRGRIAQARLHRQQRRPDEDGMAQGEPAEKPAHAAAAPAHVKPAPVRLAAPAKAAPLLEARNFSYAPIPPTIPMPVGRH